MMKFEPATLSATVGQTVRLTFVNSGAIEHDWYAEGMPVSDLASVEQPESFNQRMSGIWDTATSAG